MKKELTIAVLALGMVLSIGSAAAQQSQDSDVDVTVSTVTELDVRPSTLSYGDSGNLEPGQEQQSSQDGYTQIEVSNIGSNEIAEIYAEGDMPGNQTFGATGLNTGEKHNTGNFVTVDTSTAQQSKYNLTSSALADLDVPHYLNRVEFAEQTPPSYIKTGASNLGPAETEVGRFRVGGAEYFWVMYMGTEDTSSSTGSESWTLRVGRTPHTSTQLGTVDFTDSGSDYVEYTSSGDGQTVTAASSSVSRIPSQELVSFDTTGSGNFTGQSLLASDGSAASSTVLNEVKGTEVRQYNLYLDFASENDEADYIARTRVNTNLNDPASGTELGNVESDSQTPIFSTSTEKNKLQPGQSFPLDIGVQLPLGVAEDRITKGTVTVKASSTT